MTPSIAPLSESPIAATVRLRGNRASERTPSLDAPGTSGPARLLAFVAERGRDRESFLNLETCSDEDLVRAARQDPARAATFLDPLFRRYQKRVAAWCARTSGRREEAADMAQEVFLRVYERLDQFRFESAFGTWLYLVTRTVSINRSIANRRRDADSIDEEGFAEPADPSPSVVDELDLASRAASLRVAIDAELDPLEAKVLHLHFMDELPLAGIDRLLSLDNKSGAKAYIVSAKRKLKRHFAFATERAEP